MFIGLEPLCRVFFFINDFLFTMPIARYFYSHTLWPIRFFRPLISCAHIMLRVHHSSSYLINLTVKSFYCLSWLPLIVLKRY